MSVYNSAEETAFTKDDFEQLQKCVLLAIGIGAKVGLDLSIKRNVRDWEFLEELHTALTQIKDKLSTT
jgi:hypothetical protein